MGFLKDCMKNGNGNIRTFLFLLLVICFYGYTMTVCLLNNW